MENLRTIEIRDFETIELVHSADLSGTIIDFCKANNYVDPQCQIYDLDNDGVLDYKDKCLNTKMPEKVPADKLGANRFALVDKDNIFDTNNPKGRGPHQSFNISDTCGCSCEQILNWYREEYGYHMEGNWKYGCSTGVIEDFIKMNK